MRTTEIGACAPPSGTTPGMRRPVRTITWPPISSRRIRFGLPTSSFPSGVMVAALRPRPCSRIVRAASKTTRFPVSRLEARERSKRGSSSSKPTASGARTLTASSNNSCPVSSPSSTTIVRVSTTASVVSSHATGGTLAAVEFDHVSKIYPDGTRAVNAMGLDVQDGEFMVLVGPSGCGKTTALRMVAGLEDISEGVVRIGERVVNHVPPRDRDIAMVFQSYALYPHLSVYD